MPLAIALSIVLGAGLVGCGMESSPPVLEEPATVTPSEPGHSPAQLASCEKVLDQAGKDDLAEDNFRPIEFELGPWDYPILREFVASGSVCQWGVVDRDVSVTVGQLAMDEPTWNGMRDSVVKDGYVQKDDAGVTGFMDGPDVASDSCLTRGVTWRDGILYYASYPGILAFWPAFQS